jgi:phosphatidyl-myo-inositol dimannoside synthase
MQRPVVMLGAESLQRGASGIARVARLVARVLADEAADGRLSCAALALNDAVPASDLGIATRSARGSRPRFVYGLHRAAFEASHFIYDFAGIARAHPRLPLLRRPSLVWAHGIEVWEDARSDRLARLRAADVVVTNSEYTRARMARLHAGFSSAPVCWLATEEDREPEVTAPARTQDVLILSRLDEAGGYKGHRELIASWPAVAAASPDARLLIAGDGPGMPCLRTWVAASPARDRIDLLGFVSEAQLAALWRRAGLFAMPSRGEGFGITYIEAMRHGLPVIASIHDAGGEINVDGVTGCNVDLDREGALADALVGLLADPRARERMGEAGRARGSQHFIHPRFRQRFTPLLAQLLDR